MKNLKQALHKLKMSKNQDQTENHTRKDFLSEKVKKKRVFRKKKNQDVTPSERKLLAAGKIDPAVRRVIRGAARLADRMTETDRQAATDAIRRALRAHNVIYDAHLRRLVETPDHKTQLAAATLFLAYDEGLPVKRIEAIVADVSTPEERVELMRQSPEMLRAMRSVSGIGGAVEVAGEIIDAEVIQETGGGNEGVA